MHESAAGGAFCRDTQPCDPEVADPAPHGHRTSALHDAPPPPQTPRCASTYATTSGDSGGWSPFSTSFLPTYGGDHGDPQAPGGGGWPGWTEDASPLFSRALHGSSSAYAH